MTTSATASFFVAPGRPSNEYVVLVQNTTPAPYSIYGLMIGAQYMVPLVPTGPLASIQPVSAPIGWTTYASSTYGFLTGQTNFQGSAAASGYIESGAVGAFAFQSSTDPAPATLPFGCCFWDGANEWGFAYDGVAEQVDCVPVCQLPCFWNPPDCCKPERSDALIEGGGITTVRLETPQDGPAITLTYDRLGNIVKLVVNPPAHRLARRT
jgi:hypothetical protein